jgi:hypothetical protein
LHSRLDESQADIYLGFFRCFTASKQSPWVNLEVDLTSEIRTSFARLPRAVFGDAEKASRDAGCNREMKRDLGLI